MRSVYIHRQAHLFVGADGAPQLRLSLEEFDAALRDTSTPIRRRAAYGASSLDIVRCEGEARHSRARSSPSCATTARRPSIPQPRRSSSQTIGGRSSPNPRLGMLVRYASCSRRSAHSVTRSPWSPSSSPLAPRWAMRTRHSARRPDGIPYNTWYNVLKFGRQCVLTGTIDPIASAGLAGISTSAMLREAPRGCRHDGQRGERVASISGQARSAGLGRVRSRRPHALVRFLGPQCTWPSRALRRGFAAVPVGCSCVGGSDRASAAARRVILSERTLWNPPWLRSPGTMLGVGSSAERHSGRTYFEQHCDFLRECDFEQNRGNCNPMRQNDYGQRPVPTWTTSPLSHGEVGGGGGEIGTAIGSRASTCRCRSLGAPG